MSPQEDAALAFLIKWVTDELDERDCLPETAQDMANIFAAFDFMWPYKDDVFTEACATADG